MATVDQMTGMPRAKERTLSMAAVIGSDALITMTPMTHDFWRRADPQSYTNEQGNFLKNLALFGGASLAAALPQPWPASIGNQ